MLFSFFHGAFVNYHFVFRTESAMSYPHHHYQAPPMKPNQNEEAKRYHFACAFYTHSFKHIYFKVYVPACECVYGLVWGCVWACVVITIMCSLFLLQVYHIQYSTYISLEAQGPEAVSCERAPRGRSTEALEAHTVAFVARSQSRFKKNKIKMNRLNRVPVRMCE